MYERYTYIYVLVLCKGGSKSGKYPEQMEGEIFVWARSNNLGQAAVAWALGAWLAGSKVRFPVRAAGGADGLV
jgi:hypothetical protein